MNSLTNDPFFGETPDTAALAKTIAVEVVGRLLIWIADSRTIEERGLRTSVALYCIRPDLINGSTLEHIGTAAGCSRQAVHKLVLGFRQTMGLQA